MMGKSPCLFFLAVWIIAGFLASQAQGVPVVFTVDKTQSHITLSGNLAGFTITNQGPRSLETAYTGNINADVAGSTIQFTGSSQIIAETNGVWQPDVGGGSGSAPADYGGKASTPLGTAYGAARNLVLDLTSSSLTMTGGNFDSTELVFSFVTNFNPALDYNAPILGPGSEPLAGYSTNTVANGASLTTNGTVATLLLQVNAQFKFTLFQTGDTTLIVAGQITATNSVANPPAAPVISSIVISNQNVVISVENATAQSQLLSSTNLTSWSPTSANVTTNSGMTVFTVPVSGEKNFYRVQK